MRKLAIAVGVVITAYLLGYAAVAAISTTIPHENPLGKADDGIPRVVFPAPHTEHAYFMYLARELG